MGKGTDLQAMKMQPKHRKTHTQRQENKEEEEGKQNKRRKNTKTKKITTNQGCGGLHTKMWRSQVENINWFKLVQQLQRNRKMMTVEFTGEGMVGGQVWCNDM